MSLLCYNKGCGAKFDASQDKDDACLFHSGVPIFHDALKGWSCCKKRTTDFSEFLSIRGCTRGRHNKDKPQEPLRPEVTSEKGVAERNLGDSREIIYQGPKSAETLQKERPNSDEVKTKLPVKVATSLTQILEKLDISNRAERQKNESQAVIPGTRCKNSGCKTQYEGPSTDLEICTHHPGGPVFHEGYKFWSCCCIRTIDFNAFLDQKGCTLGKHRWIPKEDKKKVACRHDWHQTGQQVVVTIYAKNSNPEASSIEANGTVLTCHILFENNKVFHKDYHLWGVADVSHSTVSMLPSKVEVTLRKADAVAWGKLEDPNHKPEPEVDPVSTDTEQPSHPDWDIDDDDISDSDEEWAYDTGKKEEEKKKEGETKEEEDDMPELDG
ncbi:cysteine and histidine-rich domain-containing protein 1 [Osmerus eperlanus]|uniref:cysteine and histidine-rich domain-containing protein 1 n=1 Tax=Osmerus eperlanus TaxID=29151 RepID=UPI002E139BEA